MEVNLPPRISGDAETQGTFARPVGQIGVPYPKGTHGDIGDARPSVSSVPQGFPKGSGTQISPCCGANSAKTPCVPCVPAHARARTSSDWATVAIARWRWLFLPFPLLSAGGWLHPPAPLPFPLGATS